MFVRKNLCRVVVDFMKIIQKVGENIFRNNEGLTATLNSFTEQCSWRRLQNFVFHVLERIKVRSIEFWFESLR